MADEARSEEKKQERKLTLSEGLIAAASEGFIVAAFSGMAYLLAFIYEVGFANVFDIPLSFITVSLTNVFVVGGSLLLAGLVVFMVANLMFVVSPKSDSPIYRRLVSVAPLFLASIAIVFFQIGTRVQGAITGFLIGWLYIIFMQFGFPLITQRHKASYRDKLEAQDRRDAQSRDLPLYLARRLGVGLYNLIFYLSLALWRVGQGYAPA